MKYCYNMPASNIYKLDPNQKHFMNLPTSTEKSLCPKFLWTCGHPVENVLLLNFTDYYELIMCYFVNM